MPPIVVERVPDWADRLLSPLPIEGVRYTVDRELAGLRPEVWNEDTCIVEM